MWQLTSLVLQNIELVGGLACGVLWEHTIYEAKKVQRKRWIRFCLARKHKLKLLTAKSLY